MIVIQNITINNNYSNIIKIAKKLKIIVNIV